MRYNELLTETQIINLDDALEDLIDGFFAVPTQPSVISDWLHKKLKRYIATAYHGRGLMRMIEPRLGQQTNMPEWAVKLLHQKQPVYRFDPNEDIELKHTISSIIDWFHYLKDHDAPVYARLDRINFEQAAQAQKAWHEALAKKRTEDEVGEEEGAVEVLKLTGGYRWLELTEKGCLDTEGRRMGHCVGSYSQRVKDKSTRIFSLRDEKNRPHVTVDARAMTVVRQPDYTIEQVKGKGNEPPIEKYVPMVNALVKHLKMHWGPGGEQDMEEAGQLFDDDQNTFRPFIEMAAKYDAGNGYIVYVQEPPLIKYEWQKRDAADRFRYGRLQLYHGNDLVWTMWIKTPKYRNEDDTREMKFYLTLSDKNQMSVEYFNIVYPIIRKHYHVEFTDNFRDRLKRLGLSIYHGSLTSTKEANSLTRVDLEAEIKLGDQPNIGTFEPGGNPYGAISQYMRLLQLPENEGGAGMSMDEALKKTKALIPAVHRRYPRTMKDKLNTLAHTFLMMDKNGSLFFWDHKINHIFEVDREERTAFQHE